MCSFLILIYDTSNRHPFQGLVAGISTFFYLGIVNRFGQAIKNILEYKYKYRYRYQARANRD